MCVETKAKYRLGKLETKWVKTERGEKQGCVVSLTLFGMYTEELVATVRRMSERVRVGEARINILLYGDDESVDELQNILDGVGGYGRDLGVRYSSEKSKVVVVSRAEEKTSPRDYMKKSCNRHRNAST